MEKILTVKNLNVALGEQNILRDLSFNLEKGENLAIIGPNGSGKTVLLRALLGMVPYKGEIRWAPGARLGYVPQKIDADRHLPINIKNLLNAKARAFDIKSSEIGAAIEAAGLPEAALATPIGHLSGGEFQRAIIAFALLGKPNVLLLDEPTASIDQVGEGRIYELVHELQDAYGITIVLVTHDLHFVNHYATKVLCVNKTGLCYGVPEEALTPEVLRKLYGEHRRYYHHLHNGEVKN